MDLFGHKTQPKVMSNYDVITKCQCANCPVQTDSECAKPKIAARDDWMSNINSGSLQNILSPEMMKNAEMMKNTPKENTSKIMMPKVEDMPGPYCANGVAAAKTLISARCAFAAGASFQGFQPHEI